MEYNDAEKLMADCEEAFTGMDVLVISTYDGMSNLTTGQAVAAIGEEQEEANEKAKAKRVYAVAMDFVGPISSDHVNALTNLAENHHLGNYAILPQEGSVTRIQFS